MNRFLYFGVIALAGMPRLADAGHLEVQPTAITEWKAVYGQVEARDNVLARARIGGTVLALKVTEGDLVKAGDIIAVVKDEKIDFQIKAIEAQLLGLQASLKNAETELVRAAALIKSGATTAQRIEQLRTDVDVVRNQITAAEAQRSMAVEQSNEGDVVAPSSGRVLQVSVTRNAVIMPGEVVASIGGGGIFLRLAVPERHAVSLKRGTAIRIMASGKALSGTLAKIYPQIENGRVIADVEVKDLNTEFVNARVLVELPVGVRPAFVIPSSAVTSRSGIDFVTVMVDGQRVERVVVTGDVTNTGDAGNIEILTGLFPGDVVVTP